MTIELEQGAAAVQSDAVVVGDEYTFETFSLEGSGSISGATVTATIRRKGSRQKLVADVSLTISDAANRQVTLTLTEAQSALLAGDPNDGSKKVDHLLDVKMVLSNVTSHYGPLIFPVRNAVT